MSRLNYKVYSAFAAHVYTGTQMKDSRLLNGTKKVVEVNKEKIVEVNKETNIMKSRSGPFIS